MEKIDEIMEIANYCLNCKTKPCQNGCPLGNNIPEFIKCVKEDKLEEAFNVLQETTVLSSICGRICPHSKQCEGNCVRGIKGKPVDIGLLESFVGDANKDKNINLKENLVSNKKVAIIGGGPSGLTAAAFLARSGCNVTIYEKEEKLGGILNYGIPDFRLDKKVINNTIDKILQLGIQVKNGYVLGKNLSLESLKKELTVHKAQRHGVGPAPVPADGQHAVRGLFQYLLADIVRQGLPFPSHFPEHRIPSC